MAETNWGDPKELANMSRLGNVLQGMGYDPEAARANPAMRAEIMNRVAQPYPAQQRAMPTLLAQMAQNTTPPRLDTQLAAPTTPPIDTRNAAPRTPAMTPAAQPASPASSGLIVRPIGQAQSSGVRGQGSADTPASPAPGGSRPLPDTLPTSLTGAAAGGPKPATSSQVSPSGTSRPDFLGGAGQALRGGLTAAEAYERNVENAPSPEDTSAIDARIEKESTAPPLRDASGKIFHGGVDASGKPLPNYKEGIWGEIGRGAKGALEGFSIGGIPGAVMGAVNPTMFPNGKAYGAPNSNYDRAVEANQQTLAGDQQSKADLLARFKTTMDARNDQQGGYEKSVKNFGDVGKLGTEGQTAETAADKEAREAAMPPKPPEEPKTYEQAVIAANQEKDPVRRQQLTDAAQQIQKAEVRRFAASAPRGGGAETPVSNALVDAIGTGQMPVDRLSYLLARKPQILDQVVQKYPDFAPANVDSYVKMYADYHSTKPGTTGAMILSGATALGHLKELRDLNTMASHISGTPAHTAYMNKLDTLAPELAKFYGDTTIPAIEALKRTLGSTLPGNRDSAIRTQAQSMGDRLDNYEQAWREGAPSRAYEEPIPQISDKAKQNRAALDPDYARRLASEGGNTNQAQPRFAPQGHGQAAPGGGGSSWAQQHGFRKAQP